MTPACPREWFQIQHDMSDSRSIVSNMVGDEDRVVETLRFLDRTSTWRVQCDRGLGHSDLYASITEEWRQLKLFTVKLGTRLVWGIVTDVIVGLAMDALAPINIRGRTPFRQ